EIDPRYADRGLSKPSTACGLACGSAKPPAAHGLLTTGHWPLLVILTPPFAPLLEELKMPPSFRARASRGTGSRTPFWAREIRPVSSLTTRSTASVSSLVHRAARWRIPRW